MKRTLALVLALVMVVALLAGCGSSASSSTSTSSSTASSSAASTSEVTEVALKVWAPQEDIADDTCWLPQMEAKFEAAHPEYKITWTNEVGSEGDAKTNVTKDPAAAADVYMFANDQLGDLIAANAIAKLGGSYLEQVTTDNSQTMVDTVTYTDGNVYAFPFTSNTWFMYYNKDVFTEDDVKSLDTMLEKGVVSFPLNNSWYIGAFFFANGATTFGPNGNDVAAGISFGEDGGVGALNAILDMVSNPNFVNDVDGKGVSGMKSGDVAAVFTGSWDYEGLYEALGDKLGAVQLPTVNINGEAKQLKSFAGSKAIAVNPNSANQKAAMQFAAYLASVEGQQLHFQLRGITPAASSLASDPDVAASVVAVAEINTMANTSVCQPLVQEMSNWWDPAKTLGDNILNGTVNADNAEESLQKTLDVMNNGGI